MGHANALGKRSQVCLLTEGLYTSMTTPDETEMESVPARLLVVEDDPRQRASLCALLRQRHYDVVDAEDGRTALKQLQTSRYDLLLLDLKLAGPNGFQLMARLEKANIDVPVVIVSGLSSFAVVRRALRNGAFDYVRKPYDVAQLTAIVAEAISQHRRKQAEVLSARRIRASEALHRQALAGVSDIVFALDGSYRFSYLGGSVKNVLGYARRDLIGQPARLLMSDQEATRADSAFGRPNSSARAPRTAELWLKLRGADQARRCFEVTAYPVKVDLPLARPNAPPVWVPARVFGVARDVTEQKESYAFLNFQAYHDLLTRLPNRSLFRDRLSLAMAHAKRNRLQLAVMFLDLNRFKQVNDSLGHRVGDRLLSSVAARLQGCLREEDTLSRYGGDEFTLLLPQITGKDDAGVTAAKLIRALQMPFSVGPHAIRIGVSIGIAMFPDAGNSPDELIQKADIAMYETKRRGMDDYQFFSSR